MDGSMGAAWPLTESRLDQFGALLLLLIAATATGIILSAVRWLILDHLHHATGIQAPALDFRNLERKQASFMLVVENNYRFYLFYGNTLMGMLLLGLTAFSKDAQLTRLDGVRWLALSVVLYFASRDSLSRYYTRARLIMGEAPKPPLPKRRYS
ncbi:MAG: hypothetical protein SFV81_28840 [Pirellulaceae bacterium]|nr:hypothetical protein [Pirellulaceae bacterium]